SLVIATGGLSIPKIGSTDFGYRIARHFGLSISQTRPGLVPLVLKEKERRALGELSGVSLDATVRSGRTAFRENILFTHRGLSGLVLEDNGGSQCAGPLLHRRSCRRDGTPGRIQLSVGLGFGLGGRAVCLKSRSIPAH